MTACPTCGQPISQGVPAGISLDYNGRRLFVGNAEVHLTKIETDIVTVLMGRFGKVIASETLVVKVWGGVCDMTDADNALKVHISHLRKKFRGLPLSITNVWGSGFALLLKEG